MTEKLAELNASLRTRYDHRIPPGRKPKTLNPKPGPDMTPRKILLCNCPDLKVDLAAVVTELASQQVESVVLEPCCTAGLARPQET
jgi:hypothetical protein